jgi:hypothetical protein
MSKRKAASFWWMAVLGGLMGACLGSARAQFVELSAWFAISPLWTYAFRKTGICPAELMRRTSVLSWPRVFRIMYKERASRMMTLYFSAAGLVFVKGAYVVGYLVWLFLLKSRSS